MRKTSIFGHFGQNGQFWTVFGQNGQNGNFFQKSFWKFFLHLKALINCKVSEKSNEGIPRKMRKTSMFGHTQDELRDHKIIIKFNNVCLYIE